MTSETKNYCDFCGEQIKKTLMRVIVEEYKEDTRGNLHYFDAKKLDACKDCAKERIEK